MKIGKKKVIDMEEPMVRATVKAEYIMDVARSGIVDIPEGASFFAAMVDANGRLSMGGAGSPQHTFGVAVGMLANLLGLKVTSLQLAPLKAEVIPDGQDN